VCLLDDQQIRELDLIRSPVTETNFDTRQFRAATGHFLTGVTVVCTRDRSGAARGITANSFTSVSLNPPLIMVCVARSSSTYDVFCRCESFSVNVLSEGQKAISMAFASRSRDRFKGVKVRSAVTGAPIIEDSLSWMDCRPFKRVDAGDHVALFGQVEALGVNGGSPLGYWSGGYITLGLEAAATRVESRPSAYVGCILGLDNRILLRRDEHDYWSIPFAPLEGRRRNHEERITELLESLRLRGRPSFLYSVFEAPGQGTSYIVYRVELLEGMQLANVLEPSRELRFFSQDDLPRGKIWSPEGLNMLDRYFKERAVARFGVYSDAGSHGSVAVLEDPTPWQEADADPSYPKKPPR
jgi:flavin reductase (DIM6/NTAB) family NADH-FMN oxidoreductase RutF